MKKNKIYSASDFKGMTFTTGEDCWWAIDRVECTNKGEYSRAPLFKLELTQINSAPVDVPDGYEDGSALTCRNRTYFVREGRPLFNLLADIYEQTDGDMECIADYVSVNLKNKALKGHVEKLSGISYTKESKRGSTISCSKLEVWYPCDFEPGAIVDDFIYMCNRKEYIPVIPEDSDPVADAISKLDPALVSAIMAMKK